MKTLFTLTSAESRRLIAKAVVFMPEFQAAWKNAYVLLAGGTTNAFLAQEILDKDKEEIEPGRCTFGISTDGLLCVTNPDSRHPFPKSFIKGRPLIKRLQRLWQIFMRKPSLLKAPMLLTPKDLSASSPLVLMVERFPELLAQ